VVGGHAPRARSSACKPLAKECYAGDPLDITARKRVIAIGTSVALRDDVAGPAGRRRTPDRYSAWDRLTEVVGCPVSRS
jgi:hypothetical protein